LVDASYVSSAFLFIYLPGGSSQFLFSFIYTKNEGQKQPVGPYKWKKLVSAINFRAN
jgi:hypothetical protein